MQEIDVVLEYNLSIKFIDKETDEKTYSPN